MDRYINLPLVTWLKKSATKVTLVELSLSLGATIAMMGVAQGTPAPSWFKLIMTRGPNLALWFGALVITCPS